jgi:hypothetical protein
MQQGTYRKTEAGREEIRERSRRLPPAQRTVLLMTDGQRPLAELTALAEGLGAGADVFDRLVELGLIERDAPVRKGFDPAGLVQALGAGARSTPQPAAASDAGEPAVSPEG